MDSLPPFARAAFGPETREDRAPRGQPPFESSPIACNRLEKVQVSNQRSPPHTPPECLRAVRGDAFVDLCIQATGDAVTDRISEPSREHCEDPREKNRQERQQDEYGVPFHRTRQNAKQILSSRVVHGLERRGSPDAVIDERPGHHLKKRIGRINPAGPQRMPPPIEFAWSFALEDGLRYAIADLLAPIRFHRGARMVPNDRRRTEPNLIARVHQPPANIHVISRHPKDRVESSDVFESRLAKRHIATGDVLSELIVQHHLRRPSGRSIYALGHPIVLRWNNIGATNTRDVEFHKRDSKGSEPVRVRLYVRVKISHDLSRGRLHSNIPRGADALVRRANAAEGEPAGDCLGRIPRSVVDDDHFVVGIPKLLQRH